MKKAAKSIESGFTLIELLTVIAIIGILSTIVMASLTTARAKTRDAKRMSDLRTVALALDGYYSDHHAYPSTSSQWQGLCSDFAGVHTTSGANAYIPSITPLYMQVLPSDPNATLPCATSYGSTYLYTSNGADYMLLAYGTVENFTQTDNPMPRPAFNAATAPCGATTYENDFAIYSAGAQCW
jgi:prepilin-type N-terminal cleavage/methylation domain-containing protein